MFCTKCGAEIIEGTKFCIRCGTPVPVVGAKAEAGSPSTPPAPAVSPPQATPATEEPAASPPPQAAHAADAPAAAPIPNTQAGSEPAARKPDTKKLLVPGIAALAVIVALLLIFNLKGSRGGLASPEAAFETYFEGYNNGDFDLMLKACPDFRITSSGGKDSLKAIFAQDYAYYFGNAAGYQFICKATGHTLLSDDITQQIENEINSSFGTDIDITDTAEVYFDSITKNLTEGTEETASYTGGYAVKYNGKWYYFNWFWQ